MNDWKFLKDKLGERIEMIEARNLKIKNLQSLLASKDAEIDRILKASSEWEKNALDLLNQKDAEIEGLKKEVEHCSSDNRRVSKKLADYSSKELGVELLEQRLKEAEEALGFYADLGTWSAASETNRSYMMDDDHEFMSSGHPSMATLFKAGRRARAYFAKYTKEQS